MNTFKTEIVESRVFNKIVKILGVTIFIMAVIYLFLMDKENQNIYLRSTAFIIYFFGLFSLFAQSFIKPKTIGSFELSSNSIKLKRYGTKKNIPLHELEDIILKYTGYGSWSAQSIYGTKNYLEMTNKNGEKYNLEIIIKNRSVKNDFKALVNTEALSEKFQFIKMKNTTCEF